MSFGQTLKDCKPNSVVQAAYQEARRILERNIFPYTLIEHILQPRHNAAITQFFLANLSNKDDLTSFASHLGRVLNDFRVHFRVATVVRFEEETTQWSALVPPPNNGFYDLNW